MTTAPSDSHKCLVFSLLEYNDGGMAINPSNRLIQTVEPSYTSRQTEANHCLLTPCLSVWVLAQVNVQFGVLAQLTKQKPVSRREPAS